MRKESLYLDKSQNISMSFNEWNKRLFVKFFNPAEKGKIILVDIDDDDLLEVYLEVNPNDGINSVQKAIGQFISAVNAGPLIVSTKNSGIIKNGSGGIIGKISDIVEIYYDKSNNGSYKVLLNGYPPPLFLYATAMIYAAKKTEGNRFYEGFRKMFKLGRANDEEIRNSIELIWDKMEESLQGKKGQLGSFYNKKDVHDNRKYIDKVFSQFIIPKTELKRLQQVFWRLDLSSSDACSTDFYELFSSSLYTTFIQRTIPRTYGRLTSGNNDDKRLIEEMLSNQLKGFEGYAEFIEEHQGLSVENRLCKLKLAFTENQLTGYFSFQYRFHSEKMFSDQIQFGEQQVAIGISKWSDPIFRIDKGKFYHTLKLNDDVLGVKAVFKPSLEKIYVFEEGIRRRLTPGVFIEAENVSWIGQQVIIFHEEVYESVKEWILFNKGELLEDRLQEEKWLAFKFNGILQSLPSFRKLILPYTKAATITGGLKGKGQGVYITGFSLEIILEGAEGNEELSVNNLDPIPLNRDTQSFSVNFMQPGEYKLIIHSPTSLEPIKIVNDGALHIVSIERGLMDDSCQTIEARNVDQFIQQAYYNSFINLVNNFKEINRKPPQLASWKDDEILELQVNPYNRAGIQLLEFLTYWGAMSKQVFDRSVAAICNDLYSLGNAGALEKTKINIENFRKYTLNVLIESKRVQVNYNQDYIIDEIIPVKPFITRLMNATNFEVRKGGKGKVGAVPFSGELYYIGGCYNEDQVMQITKKVNEPCYKGSAEVKIYSEASTTSLNPPSFFVYTDKKSNFIAVVKDILKCEEVYGYYQILPQVSNIQNIISQIRVNPGRFYTFHSPERCKSFNTSNYQFEELKEESLPVPSLAKYNINSYEQLVIIRGEQLEAEIDLRWGRYLLLYLKAQRKGIVFFDVDRNILAVPAGIPFPREIEQVFYLSTGRLPSRKRMNTAGNGLKETRNGRWYLLYNGIIENVAVKIIECVGQSIIKTSITSG